MKNFKQTKQLLVFIVFGLILFSCQKKDIDLDNNILNETSNVSVELAKKVALNYSYDFLRENINAKKQNFRSSRFKSKQNVKNITIINDDNDLPALYIVNLEPKGFVIIAGTKKSTPVLAFSETESFDLDEIKSIPIGINSWLTERKKEIEYLRENNSIIKSDLISKEWERSAPTPDDEVVIYGGSVLEIVESLLNTAWGQGVGYNDLVNDGNLNCSNYSNGNAPTGCTATATAQVMRYWSHPNTYNWSIMPNNSGSYETSKLMRDIGDAVVMQYSCTGSGASLSNAKLALKYNFGYSYNISLVNFNRDIAVSQLNNNYPFIMQGYNSSYTEGHAWVCDGYKRNRYIWIHNPDTYYEYETYTFSPPYFRMNWGWDGWFNNAWYYCVDFTPGSNNFNYNNKMIINIHP